MLIGQSSSWANVWAGVLQGSMSGTLLPLIYKNQLPNNLPSSTKRFSDNISIFSVLHDVDTSTTEICDGLKKLNDCTFQWKMSFNPRKIK